MDTYIKMAFDSLSQGISFVWNDILDSDSFSFFGFPLSQILIFFTLLAIALTLFLKPFMGTVIKAGSSDYVSKEGRSTASHVNRGVRDFRNKYGSYGTKWRK